MRQPKPPPAGDPQPDSWLSHTSRAFEHIKNGLVSEGADTCFACGCVCCMSVGMFLAIIYFDLPV